MKIAYFNCQAGISGDMMLSSLLNSGLKARTLESLLKKYLRIRDWKLETENVKIAHATGTKTVISGDRKFESAGAIRKIYSKSSLPKDVKEQSIAILDVLIGAESRIHGIPENKVHFHELNSLDTLIDICGNVLGLSLLKIQKVISSAVNIGNPAPATLEILKRNKSKVSVYSTTEKYELATPTGIAIISTLADSFGSMPETAIEGYGFGAGSYRIPGFSDLLKVIIGNTYGGMATRGIQQDKIVMLDTSIDDMDPRVYPYLVKKLIDCGALDAWFMNISMKKGRPGILFTVLCKMEDEHRVLELIFRETTTIGVRRQPVDRYKLPRYIKGDYKVSLLPGGDKKHSVEFEKAAHKKTRKPLFELLKK